MKAKNKNKSVIKQRIIVVVLTALFLLSSLLFCLAYGYSLLIPIFLLGIGIHLHLCNKANFQLYTQLGLLLFLVVLGSHATNVYPEVPIFGLPIASVTVLTMLLYGKMQLTLIMALASSILATIIAGHDFNTFVVFYRNFMCFFSTLFFQI